MEGASTQGRLPEDTLGLKVHGLLHVMMPEPCTKHHIDKEKRELHTPAQSCTALLEPLALLLPLKPHCGRHVACSDTPTKRLLKVAVPGAAVVAEAVTQTLPLLEGHSVKMTICSPSIFIGRFSSKDANSQALQHITTSAQRKHHQKRKLETLKEGQLLSEPFMLSRRSRNPEAAWPAVVT